MSDAKQRLEAERKARLRNMALWNAVADPDKKYVKDVNVGRSFKSVDPQYTIERATGIWGVKGGAWGFKDEGWEIRPGIIVRTEWKGKEKTRIRQEAETLIYWGTLYYPECEFNVAGEEFGIVDMEYQVDNDCFKKAQTSLLSKTMSKVGFNAAIFKGAWDGAVQPGKLDGVDPDIAYGEVSQAIGSAGTPEMLDKLMVAVLAKQGKQWTEAMAQALLEEIEARRTELGAATAKRQKAG